MGVSAAAITSLYLIIGVFDLSLDDFELGSIENWDWSSTLNFCDVIEVLRTSETETLPFLSQSMKDKVMHVVDGG